MKSKTKINVQRLRRQRRTRAKIFGTDKKPRLSVFRSNKYLYAQLIDDAAGKTLTSLSSKKISEGKKKPLELAKALGQKLGKESKSKGIVEVVFDRGNYKYHGRVKALADGVRESGIKL